jgi:hypothetical protein
LQAWPAGRNGKRFALFSNGTVESAVACSTESDEPAPSFAVQWELIRRCYGASNLAAWVTGTIVMADGGYRAI